jgi:hypothetical protein
MRRVDKRSASTDLCCSSGPVDALRLSTLPLQLSPLRGRGRRPVAGRKHFDVAELDANGRRMSWAINGESAILEFPMVGGDCA